MQQQLLLLLLIGCRRFSPRDPDACQSAAAAARAVPPGHAIAAGKLDEDNLYEDNLDDAGSLNETAAAAAGAGPG